MMVHRLHRRRSGLIITLFSIFACSGSADAQCTPIQADVNGDRTVDSVDYAAFANCMAGPGAVPSPDSPMTPQSCLSTFDLDDDGHVDLFDFADFQDTYTGPIRVDCYNVVFVSSQAFPVNLGSAVAYDQKCNVLATTAGLNNSTNNAFVAWMSDANSSAATRLGTTARGFVRPDSIPVADTIQSLLTNNGILNAIHVNEFGHEVGSVVVMTGTNANGTSSSFACSNWTSTTGSASVGSAVAGPGAWTASGLVSCNQGPARIYCIEKTSTRILIPPKSQGKIIFLTNSLFLPGISHTPDEVCAGDRPAGIGTVKALVARTNAPAANVLDPESVYIRPDGQLVGTGAVLIAAGELQSGIWQQGNGSYPPSASVWTGQTNLTEPGNLSSTCSNWTSTSSAAGVGGFSFTTQLSWWNGLVKSCATAMRLYCVEQ